MGMRVAYVVDLLLFLQFIIISDKSKETSDNQNRKQKVLELERIDFYF